LKQQQSTYSLTLNISAALQARSQTKFSDGPKITFLGGGIMHKKFFLIFLRGNAPSHPLTRGYWPAALFKKRTKFFLL